MLSQWSSWVRRMHGIGGETRSQQGLFRSRPRTGIRNVRKLEGLRMSFLPIWNTLHPLTVHFPIALLLVAPLFILAGIVLPRRRAPHALLAAFVLVILGTGSLILAVETGEATAEHVTKTPEIQSVLHEHEEMAEATEVIFGAMTVLFAVLLFGPRLFRKEVTMRGFRTALSIFLLLYIAGTISLVKASHAGGRLVHELGVTAAQKASAPIIAKKRR